MDAKRPSTAAEIHQKLRQQSARWDGFSKEELDVLWLALYDAEKNAQENGLHTDAAAIRKLLNELYFAKNWLPESQETGPVQPR